MSIDNVLCRSLILCCPNRSRSNARCIPQNRHDAATMKKRKTKTVTRVQPEKTNEVASLLFGEIQKLVNAARQRVATAVNSTTVMLYWQIGARIRKDVLGDERAEYGRQIVQT